MNNPTNTTRFIVSKENDFYKKIKSYSLSKNRVHDNVVLVEGEKYYKEAIGFLNLRFTLTSEDYSPSSLFDIPQESHTTLSRNLFKPLADTKNSQGIIGIFDSPRLHIDLTSFTRVIVLEGVQDPGNVGTIIRTAFFLGYHAVLLDNACASPFSPKVIRSSAGMVFRIPSSIAATAQHLSDLEKAGFCIVGGDLRGEDLPKRISSDIQKKHALLLGSEGHGLSDTALAYCKYRYRIHSANPEAESLNVAIASGIMMYVAQR